MKCWLQNSQPPPPPSGNNFLLHFYFGNYWDRVTGCKLTISDISRPCLDSTVLKRDITLVPCGFHLASVVLLSIRISSRFYRKCSHLTIFYKRVSSAPNGILLWLTYFHNVIRIKVSMCIFLITSASSGRISLWITFCASIIELPIIIPTLEICELLSWVRHKGY